MEGSLPDLVTGLVVEVEKSTKFETFVLVVAAAAYRFGHSLVPSNLGVINSPRQRTKVSTCPLKELFHNFEDFVIGSDSSGKAWQNLLNGIANTESNFVSAVFLEPITNFLFCEDCRFETGFGQDLVARNIQRG